MNRTPQFIVNYPRDFGQIADIIHGRVGTKEETMSLIDKIKKAQNARAVVVQMVKTSNGKTVTLQESAGHKTVVRVSSKSQKK